MKETDFSKQVLKVLNRHGHACRVESPEVSAGVPDISYCVLGREGFIELKEGPKPKLRADQYRWIKKRVEAGGNAAIVWHYDGIVYWIPAGNMDNLKYTTSRATWGGNAGFTCFLADLHVGFLIQ